MLVFLSGPLFSFSQMQITVIQHELVHYDRQRWKTPLWFLQYIISKKFRLQEEVLAYKVSIKHGMRLDRAAELLLTYKTGVKYEKARKLLEQ